MSKKYQDVHAYKYTVINISDKNETGYKAIIPKFPKLHIVADTPQELHKAVLIGIDEEMKSYKKKKIPIPKPDVTKYSGKFVLRIRPEVHEILTELSTAEGITLNKYINKLIEEKVC